MQKNCKGCEKRFLGCHDTCEIYLANKELIAKQREQEKEDKDYRYMFISSFRSQIKKGKYLKERERLEKKRLNND